MVVLLVSRQNPALNSFPPALMFFVVSPTVPQHIVLAVKFFLALTNVAGFGVFGAGVSSPPIAFLGRPIDVRCQCVPANFHQLLNEIS